MHAEIVSLHPPAPTGTLRRIRRDYWEKERTKLVTSLIERLGRRGEIISLRELLALNLPEVLKAVLQNHARHVVRTEKPFVLNTQRQYRLEDQEIRSYLRALRDMLSERVVFELAELEPVLAFGVRLQFDFIVKTRNFLDSLLYRHSAERERDDILVILKGLGDRRRYTEALLDNLLGYPAGPVTKEAFSAICRQAERQVYGEHPLPAFAEDLREYLNYRVVLLGPGEEDDHLENQTVLAMLFERSLPELAESLLPELTQKEFWQISEVQYLIENHLIKAGVPISEREAETSALSPEIDFGELLGQAANEMEDQLIQTTVRELEASRAETVTELTPVSDDNLPRAGASPEPSSSIDSDKKTATPASSSPEPKSSNALQQAALRFGEEEEQLIYRSKLEQQPPGPFPSLTKLIDDKSRKSVIRKIFQHDTDAYLDFIQRMEVTQTWKEAKALLDGELSQRRINPYSREAVRLSDILFGRYFAKR